MEKSKFVRSLLFIAGIIGIVIGGSMLFSPVAFEASAGVTLGDNINLLSEIRAPGGTLLVAGVFITSGAFLSRLSHFSMLLCCLFYLSYGISRVLSMMMDGFPNEPLVIATAVEITIGLMSLFLLFRFRKSSIP